MLVRLKINSVYEAHKLFYNNEFNDKILVDETNYNKQFLDLDEVIARNNLIINPGYFEDIGEFNLLTSLNMNWLSDIKPAMINGCLLPEFIFILMNKIKTRKIYINRNYIKQNYSGSINNTNINIMINAMYKKFFIYYNFKKTVFYEFLKVAYKHNEVIHCQFFKLENEL